MEGIKEINSDALQYQHSNFSENSCPSTENENDFVESKDQSATKGYVLWGYTSYIPSCFNNSKEISTYLSTISKRKEHGKADVAEKVDQASLSQRFQTNDSS